MFKFVLLRSLSWPNTVFNAFLMMLIGLISYSCTSGIKTEKHLNLIPLEGTWQLISGATISKGDTTYTSYKENQEVIKIINKTHFAFLRHDIGSDRDSLSLFVAGGGSYTLDGNRYTEHLDFCNYRKWEGNIFNFDLTFIGDTLIQQGREKVKETNIDRFIVEKYVRL